MKVRLKRRAQRPAMIAVKWVIAGSKIIASDVMPDRMGTCAKRRVDEVVKVKATGLLGLVARPRERSANGDDRWGSVSIFELRHCHASGSLDGRE